MTVGHGHRRTTRNSSKENDKPLYRQSFYFDVKGVDVSKEEDRIYDLGGVVEVFLSKNVNYFVTANQNHAENNLRRSPRTKSSQVMTRAQMMIERVPNQSQKKSSAYNKAQLLGIPTRKLSQLKAFLTKLERNIATKSSRKKFVKFQDSKNLFQPHWKEFASFPKINFESGEEENPFVSRDRIVTRKCENLLTTCHVKRNLFNEQRNTTKGTLNPTAGYCELCCETFENMKHHVDGRKHKSYLSNNTFDAIDKIISADCSLHHFMSRWTNKRKQLLSKEKRISIQSKLNRKISSSVSSIRRKETRMRRSKRIMSANRRRIHHG